MNCLPVENLIPSTECMILISRDGTATNGPAIGNTNNVVGTMGVFQSSLYIGIGAFDIEWLFFDHRTYSQMGWSKLGYDVDSGFDDGIPLRDDRIQQWTCDRRRLWTRWYFVAIPAYREMGWIAFGRHSVRERIIGSLHLLCWMVNCIPAADFDSAGNIPVNNIAKWDGEMGWLPVVTVSTTGWSPLAVQYKRFVCMVSFTIRKYSNCSYCRLNSLKINNPTSSTGLLFFQILLPKPCIYFSQEQREKIITIYDSLGLLLKQTECKKTN